jgi:hypothetical protein
MGERAEAVRAGTVRGQAVLRGKGEQVEAAGAPVGARAVAAEPPAWAPAEREAVVERPAPGPVVRRVAMADTAAAPPREVGVARGLPEVRVARAEHRLASPSDRRARVAVSAVHSSAPAVARCRSHQAPAAAVAKQAPAARVAVAVALLASGEQADRSCRIALV